MNCKQGDLAIVKRIQGEPKSPDYLRLLGTTVTVEAKAPHGMLLLNGFGHIQQHTLESRAWQVSGRLGKFLIRDSSLMPLGAGDLDERIDAGEKLHKKESV